MGGLLRDWKHFSDPLNNIRKPSQMGPLRVEAKHLTGQPIDEHLWIYNPVDTSYPSSMAVKAAEKKSPFAGEAMLELLREAVLIHQKHMRNTEVILEIPADLEELKNSRAPANFRGYNNVFIIRIKGVHLTLTTQSDV